MGHSQSFPQWVEVENLHSWPHLSILLNVDLAKDMNTDNEQNIVRSNVSLNCCLIKKGTSGDTAYYVFLCYSSSILFYVHCLSCKRPPLRLSKDGLHDHTWAVPKVVLIREL